MNTPENEAIRICRLKPQRVFTCATEDCNKTFEYGQEDIPESIENVLWAVRKCGWVGDKNHMICPECVKK